jgi:hypothetical protein
LIRQERESAMPLSSSSYNTSGVIEARRTCFERLTAGRSRLDPATLFRFHASHSPGRSAFSPCMHREDARTVSFSWIKATREAVEFRYHPDSPCTANPENLAISEIKPRQSKLACASTVAKIAYQARASRPRR